MASSIPRSYFLTGTAALASMSVALVRRPACAAEFTLKLGTDLPENHPTITYLRQAADLARSRSEARVDVQVFSNSQLGNDSQMLSQVRTGAIDMMAVGDNILATLVPVTAIDNVGFVWANVKAPLAASDGALGAYIRGEIEKTGLHVFAKIWDEGFRETTTSTHPIITAADFSGVKIRVPPSPISTSLFKALGASPTTINASEMYSALQTHIVDGEENPLATISAHKLSEVQKYCSLTNHMWVGYWILVNAQTWTRLPKEIQENVASSFDETADKQRAAVERENNDLQAMLTSQGLKFNNTDPTSFRKQLAEVGFYKQWRETFGETAWLLLEKYAGSLG
ncbi:MAG TPA: TRAP transporter substrate-binding protein [Candidatus Baltobacteraceae bacterium]|jgi:tripartite ATP-independent transporter DctP family solute receptor|nr:TRAP transporter substrate-binding protein [Candidatus Baltobacteraceae bacterium]